jgi:hypothetical protein
MNLGQVSVIDDEIFAIMMAMEIASRHGWNYLLIENNSTASLSALEMPNIVPWNLRNCWCNCLMLCLHITQSHLFREDNHCADKLANHGHIVGDLIWWVSLPLFIRGEFLNDKR